MLSGELFYYMASGPLCQHLFFVFAEFFSLAPAASILQLNSFDAVRLAFLPAVSKHSFCIIPKGLILVNTLFGFFLIFSKLLFLTP